jgi:DNA repair exonuclease SbcCD nuclease subunit
LAGDTFEHNAIDRVTVAEVACILGAAGRPVFVIPGNHDPAVTGSVWEDPCWARHSNVRVLLAREPVPVPGGTIYPCPLLVPHSSLDPTAWIPCLTGDSIRIGLAHGTVEGLQVADDSYPISRDLPNRAKLDYVGLGHFHSTALYESDGTCRMAYSGTHEPTAFGERDSGNALIVEIAGVGTAPMIKKLPTANLQWLQIIREVNSANDLREVLDELLNLPNAEDKLVECRLSGHQPANTEDLERQISETVDHRFQFGRYESQMLMDDAHPGWIDDLPPGYLQEAARELAVTAPQQLDRSTPRTALRELGRIWQEVRQ